MGPSAVTRLASETGLDDSLDRVTTEAPAAGEHEHRPASVLVVENDPDDGVLLLGDWLAEGGLELSVVRPHAGDRLPETPDGHAALVVVGREPLGDRPNADLPNADLPSGASRGGDAAAERDRSRALERLLGLAVQYQTPTLGIGVGARLLATAHGGRLTPAGGPELGHRLVARRDVADRDALFGPMPFAPDVVQWHSGEIAKLPDGTVTLAVSTSQAVRVFRVGPAAWGLRLHIECDLEAVASWAMDEAARLVAWGCDPIELLDTVDRALPDVAEAWRPFALRFAELALGGVRTRHGGDS